MPLGRSTSHNHSKAMKEKSGQKTAIIVGMLIKYADVLTKGSETYEAFYQAPALAELQQQPASQRLASKSQSLRRMSLQEDDAH